MSRTIQRRVARLEGTFTPSLSEEVLMIVDRGASEEDRAEGDARVEELYESGKISRDAKHINLIHVRFVAPT